MYARMYVYIYSLSYNYIVLTETGIPENASIVTYIMPLPPNNEKLTLDITNILGGLLFPFAASFLFPVNHLANSMIIT